MSRRLEKISDLIMRELGRVIQNEISDPRIGFVTLSRVKISPDLSHAEVFVSVMGSEQDEANSLAGLKSSASFLFLMTITSFSSNFLPMPHSHRLQI